MATTAQLAKALAHCRSHKNPLDEFNRVVLRRGPYWAAQRAMAAALWDPIITNVVVPAGHSVGKSYFASGAILGWLTMLKDSGVMSTGPANTQLSTVLWGEIRKARKNSPYLRRLGKLTKLPNQLAYDEQWKALGFSTDKDESLQGFHPVGPLLNVLDEASGIENPSTWATMKSLKPRKTIAISNPLRPEGPFFELCQRALSGDPTVRLIRIPSTSSPDILIEHSTRGLADAAWLREMAADYGVGSPVWDCRVLAKFPGSTHNQLVPGDWFARCVDAPALRLGDARISIDLAGGSDDDDEGGDRSVILTRDDGGILDLWESNTADFGETAAKAAELLARWRVHPSRVTYDKTGLGEDFANRLEQVGIRGASGYKGGAKGGKRFRNLRTAAAWLMHNRLDPGRMGADGRPQTPFRIPKALAEAMRPEVCGLRYELVNENQTGLEAKKHLAKRLRRSPDLADALIISYAYPNI
jgi:phage terminase large subunit